MIIINDNLCFNNNIINNNNNIKHDYQQSQYKQNNNINIYKLLHLTKLSIDKPPVFSLNQNDLHRIQYIFIES